MPYGRLYSQETCKHEVGFQLRLDCTPPAWVCNRWCGFRINFDPDKYPDGVAIRSKTEAAKDP